MMSLTVIYLMVCFLYRSETASILTVTQAFQHPTTTTVATCEYGGVYYDGDFQPDPCTWCTCPEDGGTAECIAASCPLRACVDGVHVEGQCCPSCPNGPNCFALGVTIPAGEDVVVGDSICRCQTFNEDAFCRKNGCYLFGTLYEPGTDFNPSPCESCHCPVNGSEPTCAIMDCAAPQCNDYYFEDDICCPICPTERSTETPTPTTTDGPLSTTAEEPTTTERRSTSALPIETPTTTLAETTTTTDVHYTSGEGPQRLTTSTSPPPTNTQTPTTTDVHYTSGEGPQRLTTSLPPTTKQTPTTTDVHYTSGEGPQRLTTSTSPPPTTTQMGCTIRGVYFSPGALNPINGCQRCDPAASPNRFTQPKYDMIAGGQITCSKLCKSLRRNTRNYLKAVCTFATIPLLARNQICLVTDVSIYSTLTCSGVTEALIDRLVAFCSANPIDDALTDPNACY